MMANGQQTGAGGYRASWNCVALGDTWAGGFLRHLAVQLERELPVDITIHDWRREAINLAELADALHTQEAVQERVREAEVVVVTLALPREGLCVSGEGEGLFGESPLAVFMQMFRADLSWMLDGLLALTGPERALIRMMDFVCPFAAYWPRWAGTDECMRAWMALNSEVYTLGSAAGIPVARLFDAFHGHDGAEDPWARGYIALGTEWITDVGAKVVARCLGDLGYRLADDRLPGE